MASQFTNQIFIPNSLYERENVTLLIFILVVLTMPFSIPIHSASVGVLFANALYRAKLSGLPTFEKPHIILALPTLLFLVYLVNVFRAVDFGEGLKQVEKRIPLLLFPIIILLIGGRLRSIDKKIIFRTFVLLMLFVSIICYGYATLNVISNGSFKVVTPTEREYFYFSYLYLVSPSRLDPIYMSLYSNLCIIYLLFLDVTYHNTIKYVIVIYLSVFVLLISSKIGIIFLFLALLIKLITESIRGKSKFNGRLILLFLPFFIASILFVPFIKERLWQSLDYDYSWDYSGSWNSMSQRLAIWDSAKETIVRSPIVGFGTSNGQLELEKVYKEEGYVRGYEDHYNAHNEYVHTTLEAGILGLLILLLVLGYPFLKCIKKKSSFSVIFLLMISVYFMVEVILARQKGVSLFAFFYCLTFTETINERDDI